MRKRFIIFPILLAMAVLLPLLSSCKTGGTDTIKCKAVYLGIENHKELKTADVRKDGAKIYKFQIGNETRLLAVQNDPEYTIQNKLMEQYNYRITVKDDTVVDARLLDDMRTSYKPVLTGKPGLKTLKNFLATAFTPVGTALYVWGGNWTWQDEGTSIQGRSLGVSKTWVDFYNSKDDDYFYQDYATPWKSYNHYSGWNQYYYAGIDCSGFVGWTLYNTLESKSGKKEGYVHHSHELAKKLADEYGYGTWTNARLEQGEGYLRPGDIVSQPGHVWICLGRCSDGSILLIHSSPTKSVTGKYGGGVQMSALNPHGNTTDCEAYRLASYYVQKYYPQWAKRYPAAMKSFEDYVCFDRKAYNGSVGFFRWNLDGTSIMTDPDGYADLSAEQILEDLFKGIKEK